MTPDKRRDDDLMEKLMWDEMWGKRQLDCLPDSEIIEP
jgi:hypothetical protein